MPHSVVVVDPAFGATLRRLRNERDLSLRRLGKLVSYSHTQLWELETGRAAPTRKAALQLDDALDAAGHLAALVIPDSQELTPDDDDRLARAAAAPRTVDPATIESLSVILAHERRLEDRVGSAALVVPVVARLAVVEDLAAAARGRVRPVVVDAAAQWAQFAGWLHANTQRPAAARQWYGRALEWATEVGDPNMIATALNMRGHLAWLSGQVGPMVGLSQAAARQPASAGVRALAAQQEARGHALVGEADDVDRLFDVAAELVAASADNPAAEPPWIYFYDPAMLTLQRGLAYRYLGRHKRAVDLLRSGLEGMPADVRDSEWIGTYVVQLARALGALGELDEARRLLGQARAVASATGSLRLAELVRRAQRALSDGHLTGT